MENEVKCVIKWNGKEYEVNSLSGNDTVGTLKDAIFKKTGVRPERQKLLNLKFKGKFYIYLHKLRIENFIGNDFPFSFSWDWRLCQKFTNYTKQIELLYAKRPNDF